MTEIGPFDEIPDEIRQTTERLLTGDADEPCAILRCAEWWCRQDGEDSVVSELAVMQLHFTREPMGPHQSEKLEKERENTVFAIKADFPELVP